MHLKPQDQLKSAFRVQGTNVQKLAKKIGNRYFESRLDFQGIGLVQPITLQVLSAISSSGETWFILYQLIYGFGPITIFHQPSDFPNFRSFPGTLATFWEPKTRGEVAII